MEINLDNLIFKLQPPTPRKLSESKLTECQLPSMKPLLQTERQMKQDTSSKKQQKNHQEYSVEGSKKQCGLEEETLNPFRKTSSLFKHIGKFRKQSAGSSQNTLPHFNQVFSMENFDSFQDKSTKILINPRHNHPFYKNNCQRQQYDHKFNSGNNFLSFKGEGNFAENDYIRIQNDCQPDNIENYSIIMDDINSTLKISEIIPDSKHNFRSKTEPYNTEEALGSQYGDRLHLSSKQQKIKIKKCGTFFLTQQSQTHNQQSIKEFYMDLKEQTKLFSSKDTYRDIQGTESGIVHYNENIQSEDEEKQATKKKIKKLIYNFADQIDIVKQSEISPQFIEKLEDCLNSFLVKKPKPLNQLTQQCNLQYTPRKWNKSQKKHSSFFRNINESSVKSKNYNMDTKKLVFQPKQNISKNENQLNQGFKEMSPNTGKKWGKASMKDLTMRKKQTETKTKPIKPSFK